VADTTYTFCHICEQNCGLEVVSENDRIISIGPDRANPWSWRDFCIKAARQADIVHHSERLRTPLRRVGDRFVPATYEEAIDDIATRLKAIVAEHGPDAVGCYSGNPGGFNFGARVFLGQLLDGIGTNSRFAVGSIDQNAWHVTMDLLFGNALIPLIPDIDASDCFLFIGANPAISKMCWLGKVPDGWRRTLARVKDGAELIVVDPRRTETAQKATLHVAPMVEQDWAFLLGVIRCLFDAGLTRPDASIATVNRDALKELATRKPLEWLAQRAGVSVGEIAETAARFGRAERPVAISRTGPAMGRNGVITEWLTQCLNLLLARLDVPGGRYMPAWPVNFAVMAELFYPPKRLVSRVRKLPAVSGSFSVAEIPDEILTPGKGQIRAFLLHAGNIVNTGPDGDRLDRAFADLELLVGVDLFQRESHRHAHWLIPGLHFLERAETPVTLSALNDRPFLQTGRVAVPPPDGIWDEWRFFLELGRKMGLSMFPGIDAPDPDMVSRRMLADSPISLEQVHAAEHGLEFGPLEFGHLSRFLAERERKVDLAGPELVALLEEELLQPAPGDQSSPYPLALIGRRRNNLMNSWLSDTVGREGHDVRADAVEMNRADAERQGLRDGQPVLVESATAAVEARLICSNDIRGGVAVMEHGWGARIYRPLDGGMASDTGVNRNRLVSGHDLAPLTGVPRLNGTPVRIIPLEGWTGRSPAVKAGNTD
jgi:formate dehydrogenase